MTGLATQSQHISINRIVDLDLAWQRANKWRRLAENTLRDGGIDVDPDADVSTLSYGIRKRIEVVRALMSQPRLLMLDEPVAGLNMRETAELSVFLKSVARDGVTCWSLSTTCRS